MLLKLVGMGKIDPSKMITHSKKPFNLPPSEAWRLILATEFQFSEIEQAYKIFGEAAKHDALKVLIDV